jgi:hypothetical protein
MKPREIAAGVCCLRVRGANVYFVRTFRHQYGRP